MDDWSAVTLTQARQVAALMGRDEDMLPDPVLGIEAGYRDACARSAADGVDYLAHALPRLEAIGWAAHLLHAESFRHELVARDRLALDYALRWLGKRCDDHRRAAHRAAQAAGRRSAERYLGLAVFFSGGSISEPELPPVPPPPEASGRWAAGAIKQAGYRTQEPEELFVRALRLGEGIAARGLAALVRP